MLTFYCKTKDKKENKKTNHFVVTKLLISMETIYLITGLKWKKSSGLKKRYTYAFIVQDISPVKLA